ncbi:MAG: DUF6057 family protein [Prevotellaceae bacterium]|nr:DUF6057 family protein [Prevotellaceae bacterium]
MLLYIAVMLWWTGSYLGTISYHEQLQMFLCNGDYFCERVALPGGLADYVSEFLVSFFFYAQIGAGIIAALVVMVQLLSWCMIRRHCNTAIGFAMSFVPAVLVWAVLGNPDILISLPVAMIGVMAFCCIAKPRIWLMAILLPVAYWLFGPMFYGMAIYFAVWAIIEKRWFSGVFAVVMTIAIMVASSLWLNYPLYRVLVGLNYYRFPTTLPYIMVVPMLLASLLPFANNGVVTFAPVLGGKGVKTLIPALVVCVLPCFLVVKSMYVKEVHDVLEYDYLVRTTQWNKIIAKAGKKSPDTPNTVVSLNLALQQVGRLPYNQFNYFQNGSEGLLQSCERDFVSPVPTAEAMFRLGMINAAQEYYFEAQEAIPNFLKSGRLTRRLAETNIINGQYEVARKYLKMLQQTICYADWAAKTEALLGNEKAINEHPVYGEARKCQYTDDFLFSDKEMDMMLGLLLVKNPQNKMAYEYLMSYIILNRNLEHFYEYFQLGKDLGYKEPPTIYQDVHAAIEARNTGRSLPAVSNNTWNYLFNGK